MRKAFCKAKRNPNLVFCVANVGGNRQNKFELIRTANLALEGEGFYKQFLPTSSFRCYSVVGAWLCLHKLTTSLPQEGEGGGEADG